MKFTDFLWDSIGGIYKKILEHPFIQGLTDGSLSEEAFVFYAVQDALYLRDFARGLAIIGAKAPEDRWLMMFAEHARDTIQVERALHESFFRDWKLTEEEVYKTPPAPNNLLYTSYLLKVAYERPFHEGMGAFLPCYWIYGEVGKELEKRGSPKELFRRWIQTYASEEFDSIVQQVLKVMDEISLKLTDSEKGMVREHFVTTSKMEYLFWDMGFSQQRWPV
ncbi:MAG: thiaminase II [Deltaproteobacteria bacterium]|nr:MAG: thiaminase II [Deltaproteobacteria bacterium]